MVEPGWSRSESPFHRGERLVQERLGVRDRMDRQGRRIIRDYLTEQHQQFFAQLSYVIAGTVDADGYPWASVLVGNPGFLAALDRQSLRVRAKPLLGDPFAQNLVEGGDIGLLGIELNTRRRNRLNGVIRSICHSVGSEASAAESHDDRSFDVYQFEIEVKQSFGNCPQYIQARTLDRAAAHQATSADLAPVLPIHSFKTFSMREREWIGTADTFFIATTYQDQSEGLASGVDVSHRGGKPGFVRMDGDDTLTVPDFSGNFHFNTFGNLELNPRAGLLFIDFSQGDLLYLTGTARVIWEGPEVEAYEGAERLLQFQLEQGYRANSRLPLRWSAPEFSPFLDRTGIW